MKLLTGGSTPLVTDPIVLNAFNNVDRVDFVLPKHTDMAYQDRLLHVGYGEVLTSPTLLAKLLEMAKPRFGTKILHLGTGTGYLANLLGYIAGSEGKVYSLERVQWLWEKAREFHQAYKSKMNLDILYRDGHPGLPDEGEFDGIYASFVYPEFPEHLKSQLAVGGKLVIPSPAHILKIIERVGPEQYVEETVPNFSSIAFGSMKNGVV
jgi:protein-L-isoaspartate(D-aspartate) O-methyltransferase